MQQKVSLCCLLAPLFLFHSHYHSWYVTHSTCAIKYQGHVFRFQAVWKENSNKNLILASMPITPVILRKFFNSICIKSFKKWFLRAVPALKIPWFCTFFFLSSKIGAIIFVLFHSIVNVILHPCNYLLNAYHPRRWLA